MIGDPPPHTTGDPLPDDFGLPRYGYAKTAPGNVGAVPLRTLTEDDVRRIVREEMAARSSMPPENVSDPALHRDAMRRRLHSTFTRDTELCVIAREVRALVGMGYLGDAQRRLDDLIALLDDMAGLDPDSDDDRQPESGGGVADADGGM